MKPLRVRIPACRDPFINAPLTALGPGRDGEERFWISTWNAIDGSTGVVVTPSGRFRIYRFRKPFAAGFYSAAPVARDTLWLCGGLSRVVCLDLNSGAYEVFETGAPGALVFQGMVHDPTTGKLFAAAYPMTDAGTCAFSYDVRRRRPCRVFEDVAPDRYMRSSFPNGDGTHSILLTTPGWSLVTWDPRDDSITTRRLHDGREGTPSTELVDRVTSVAGRVYLPGLGWYTPSARRLRSGGKRPQREMCWFGSHAGEVFGYALTGQGDSDVGAWNPRTGVVRSVVRIPDLQGFGLNLTTDGRLVSVSTYGELRCTALSDGRLLRSARLPVTGVQHTDCLRRIDADRLLGTPFITQRFWEVNLRTGKGFDCGRAAPGAGEILQTWRIGRRIYMAEYGGGRLVEYDPTEHPHFPENPRTVANPPLAMRPIAAANDDRRLFYSCSAPYGRLGSTVVGYDTRDGRSWHAVNPLRHQRIASLYLDRRRNALLCGTSYTADCGSYPPRSRRCCVAWLDAVTLRVVARRAVPAGATAAHILGPLGPDRWLCRCDGHWPEAAGVPPRRVRYLVVEGDALSQAPQDCSAWPEGLRAIVYVGRGARYVLHVGDRLEVWDLRALRRLARLDGRAPDGRVSVDGQSVYVCRAREVWIWENCL